MKTTNFENSKKLAEIGFVGESETWKHDPDNFITGQKYWSYDLETLLNALPVSIGEGEYYLVISLTPSGAILSYGEGKFSAEQEEDESLTDTAARLLIQLFEAGMINFNK